MRFKDWQPGEFRVKIQIVTDKGSRLDYYLPHTSPELGQKAIDLGTEIVTAFADGPITPEKSDV